MNSSGQRLFPSSKVIVKDPYNPDKILLIKRKSGNGYHEPAGGRVEINSGLRIGENLEQCALREAKEELGLTLELDKYIGSYYFFWKSDPQKCSVCALFTTIMVDESINFVSKNDFDIYEDESKFDAEWVSLDAIRYGKIKFDPIFIGLDKLMKSL